jgi:hypothetical protein
VPPIPKAIRSRRPIGGAGPRLKANRPSATPMSRTGEREGSIACDASESESKKDSFEVNCAVIVIIQGVVQLNFQETSLAMMKLMQQQINLLMKDTRPQKRGPWRLPSEFKVASNRTREKERTSALVR